MIKKTVNLKFDPSMCSKIFLYANPGINLPKKIIEGELAGVKTLVICPARSRAELVGLGDNAEIWLYDDLFDIDEAIKDARQNANGEYSAILMHDATELNQVIYNYIVDQNAETMGLKGDPTRPKLEAADWSTISIMTRDRINAFEGIAGIYIVTAKETRLSNSANEIVGISPSLIGSLREQFISDFPEIFRVSSQKTADGSDFSIRTRPIVGVIAKDSSGKLAEMEKSFSDIICKLGLKP